jgi:hypothetical protein
MDCDKKIVHQDTYPGANRAGRVDEGMPVGTGRPAALDPRAVALVIA